MDGPTGFLLGALLVLGVIGAGFIGAAFGLTAAADECKTFGSTKIAGTVYVCHLASTAK